MALFADSVPREWLEDMRQQRDHAQAQVASLLQQYAGTVADVVAIKRHDLGMVPQGFDPTVSNPVNLLGPRTVMAIDKMCNGLADLRAYLVNQAIQMTTELKGGDPERKVDQQVADQILAGDEG